MEVVRPGHQKKFLGGYRHQLTGVEYHHAAVQTLQKKTPGRGVQVFSRDTQVTTKHQERQHQFDRAVVTLTACVSSDGGAPESGPTVYG